jgi:hypothetical protein
MDSNAAPFFDLSCSQMLEQKSAEGDVDNTILNALR